MTPRLVFKGAVVVMVVTLIVLVFVLVVAFVVTATPLLPLAHFSQGAN